MHPYLLGGEHSAWTMEEVVEAERVSHTLDIF